MLISMGDRNVGQGTPVFIVFEAGPTHTGLDSARLLARHAKDAGADAIKFQITNHNRLIRDRSLVFSYQAVDAQGQLSMVTEPLYDIWQRRWMPPLDWQALKKYCDEIGICFFATVFSPEDVDLVRSMGVHSLKIASQDTNYRDLIEYAADTSLPVQLDTGGSSLGEVERAVDWVRERGNERIIVNHCPSGYPARLESINLRMIRTVKKVFPYPVAFSDHNPGLEMDVAAVAVGADIIEKTITLDRTQRSCEHMFSLEPPEMARFVEVIRSLETAMGSERRVVGPDQRKSRDALRRSAYLVRDVRAGERLKREDFEFMRPGYGIRPDEYQRFVGLEYRKDMTVGTMLSPEDF